MYHRLRSLANGLQGQLIFSNLVNSLIGIIAIFCTLLALKQVSDRLIAYSSVSIPMVESLERLDANLQISSSATQGWIYLADNNYITQRRESWDIVNQSLDEIKNISSQSSNSSLKEIESLENKMDDLMLWQWRVIDIAQTPGDNQGKWILQQILMPVADVILNDVSRLMQLNVDAEITEKLAQYQFLLSQNLNAIITYTLDSGDLQRERAEAYIHKSDKLLYQLLKDWRDITNEQQVVINAINTQVTYYQSIFNDIINIKKSKYDSMAADMFNNEVMPLSSLIQREINVILGKEISQQKSEFTSAIAFIKKSVTMVWFFIFVTILLAFILAIVRARKIIEPISKITRITQKIASGERHTLLEVEGADELSELTHSLNEMQMKQSLLQERLNKTINLAVDPIFTINQNGIIQSCNIAATKLFGYQKEELIGYNIALLMPEPYRSHHDGYLSNYLKTRNPNVIGKSREIEAMDKSGNIIPASLSVSEIKVGEDTLFTGIIRDIRAEKSFRDEIEQSNLMLEQENKNKNIAIELTRTLTGIDNSFEFSEKTIDFISGNFNSCAEIFYGINHQEEAFNILAAQGANDQVMDGVNLNEGILGKCYASKQVVIVNDLKNAPDKVTSGFYKVLPASIVLLPIVERANVIAVIEVVFLNNCTDEIMELLNTVASTMSSLLAMCLSREQVNNFLNEITNQNKMLAEKEDRLQAFNDQLTVRTNELKQSEEELKSTNEELTTQLQLIAQQKNELTEKSNELSLSSQYKSEFLANMSHELRTPLNSLLILAQGLMKNKTGNLTAEQVNEASVIYSAGNDLLTLINDILDIAKVESGKMEVECIEVNLNALAQDLSSKFSVLAHEKGLAFEVVTENTDLCIYTDPLRLSQILRNLLGNAIKFTQQGSVKLIVKKDEQQVLFTVQDSGVGIPADKLKLIFNEFQQADGSTSRQYGGTGLGLSISKKLAELLGGKITVTSKVDIGSEFCFSLPADACLLNASNKSSITADTLTKANPTLWSKKILIVEDDKINQKGLQETILSEHSDLELDFAASASDALDLLKNNTYACVIVDLGLPDMPGIEFVKEINEHDSMIPIIVHTARDITPDEQAQLSQYTDKVVIKGNNSLERLCDELSLFLNYIGSTPHTHIIPSTSTEIVEFDGQTILVVDDDLRNSFALSKILQELNLKVIIADNGELALTQLTKETVDLILMDVMMPVLDGYQTIARIRETKAIKHIPIIALTAKASMRDKSEAIEAGANDYLSKPIDVDQLKAAMHQLLGRINS